MTKHDLYDPFSFAKTFSPTSVGFDSLLRRMEEMATKTAKTMGTNWPPFNLKKIDENKYVIEIAVAGFSKQDIEIELEEGVLKIKGQTNSSEDETYLHKGIADRAFTRQFSLADTVEIKNAELVNGMLKVWLENIIPDYKKPKKIEINDTASYPTSKELLTEEDKVR